jgi:hypothetical protein
VNWPPKPARYTPGVPKLQAMLGKNLMQSIHKSNPVNGLDKVPGHFCAAGQDLALQLSISTPGAQ